MSKHVQDMSDAIAIIGVSCRLPKANNVEAFWEALLKGEELISRFSRKDLEARGVPSRVLDNQRFVPAAASLDSHDLFDARFFNLLPREVEVLDPQQRKFLECCWEAWEDAGYTADYCIGSVGVFGGITMNTYLLEHVAKNKTLMETLGHLQLMIGNDKDFVTTRVSHQMDFRGPSYAVQSACSSSLLSIHVACTSLLTGESDYALAGGSSIRYPHGEGYMYFVGGTSSPDGHCRSFDKDAAGSVVGNGAGVLVLKRYEDAVRDKDHIYSVIIGSATGNDGSDKPAYSTPSAQGQAAVISSALAMADVDSATIGYVEAHGTGTNVGDPIEVSGLRKAYTAHQKNMTDKSYCVLGSVKPNIGHLDAAAGVSGVIKVMQMLRHKTLPPLVNFNELNPSIPFKDGPFEIIKQAKSWQRKKSDLPLRAGVSSVGLGGANAHVILQEAPEQNATASADGYNLVPISARTPSALAAYCDSFQLFLEKNAQVNISDLAYTMQVGRRSFEYRKAFLVSSASDLLSQLKTAVISERKVNCAVSGECIFMFPGQGAQYSGMAKLLYKTYKPFQVFLDENLALFSDRMKCDLSRMLFSEKSEELNRTLYTQPIIFSVEYALAQCFIALGLRPEKLIGHSIGEFVAAGIAEVFKLEDLVSFIVERAKLSDSLPVGCMLSIVATVGRINVLLSGIDGVNVSVINAKNRVVVSGDEHAISDVKLILEKENLTYVPLRTSHAFHSPIFDSIVSKLEKRMAGIQLSPPKIPLVSNETGEFLSDIKACDITYWARHIRTPVNFCAGINMLDLDSPNAVFLEVGPGATLTTLAMESLTHNQQCISALGHKKSKQSEVVHFYESLATLWESNVHIDWQKVHADSRSRLSLPTYPFELKRYFIDRPRLEDTPELSQQKEPEMSNIPPLDKRSTDALQNALQGILETIGNRSVTITLGAPNVAPYSAQHVQAAPTYSAQSVIDSVNAADNEKTESTKAQAVPDESNNVDVKVSLLAVWVELLGYTAEELDDDTSISEYGAHSLVLTQLLTRVKQRFDVDCTLEEILANQTLLQMAALIEAKQGTSPVVRKAAISPEVNESNLSEVMALADGMTESEINALLNEA